MRVLTVTGLFAAAIMALAQASEDVPSLRGVADAAKNEKWPPLDAKGDYLCKMPGQSPCPQDPVVCTLLFCECSTMGNCKWYDRPADWGTQTGPAGGAPASTPAAPATPATPKTPNKAN